MTDAGYFNSVSANLKASVGAQVEGSLIGSKGKFRCFGFPSVNALGIGVKL